MDVENSLRGTWKVLNNLGAARVNPVYQKDRGPTDYGTSLDSVDTLIECILSFHEMLACSLEYGISLRCIEGLRICRTNTKLTMGVPELKSTSV